MDVDHGRLDVIKMSAYDELTLALGGLNPLG